MLIHRVKHGDCWRYVGPHGAQTIKGKKPHVWSAVLWRGHVIGSGKIVCHTCLDRDCWNPHHLYVGTYHDNAWDEVAKGVGPVKPEEAVINRVSDEDMQRIKERFAAGESSQAIAEDYPVSYGSIHKIATGYYDHRTSRRRMQ